MKRQRDECEKENKERKRSDERPGKNEGV